MVEFVSLGCFALLLFISWLPIYSSFTISSFQYPETKLKPYEWRYIRVDVPPEFSSLSMNLKSSVNIHKGDANNLPRSKLPLICFRNGSPPLPDISNTSLTSSVSNHLTNDSVREIQDLQGVDCHVLQKNITLVLTNEQISPGAWYIGLFNGIGSTIQQGKMIIRGSDFSFSANISVEGCTTSTMWGPYCNQTVVPLFCAQSDVYHDPKNLSGSGTYNQTIEIVPACRNSFDNVCHGYSALMGYSLDIIGMVQQLSITATNVQFNQTGSANNTWSANAILYARHGALPSNTFYDYSSDTSTTSLVIRSPRVGRWYISVVPVNQTIGSGVLQDNNTNAEVCYSLDWEILECPAGKVGPNCTWENYMLQTVLRKNPSVPFESHYLPVDGNVSPDSTNFPLEPLISNSSLGNSLGVSWTYFSVDIPRGAAGGHIHVQLKSDAKLDYEIYSRFGGLPSLDTWDYWYANSTSSSNGSVFFKLYGSSAEVVSFYILYAKEGTWFFGLRHPVSSKGSIQHQTTMSIASERCPRGCSPHGKCQNIMDASGLAVYSFCSCDRTHGGFDCSIEIVSPKGHKRQSIALIVSNAAVIFPACYALRKKAFAEWVLFTTSGISSGLYHACDVGTWCVLSFHVLQFMDFWLSFMAVVSTFVYLATLAESTKRTIHTAVAILTALMAITGATRSSNIIYVIAIGAAGLVIGWMIEASTLIRSISCSTRLHLNALERWKSIKDWFYNLLKTLRDRFRWMFVILGFGALSLAAISWKLETSESYWIWHSIWHVSIYTSSFFFFCSKITTVNRNVPEGQSLPIYELARQNSLPRGE